MRRKKIFLAEKTLNVKNSKRYSREEIFEKKTESRERARRKTLFSKGRCLAISLKKIFIFSIKIN